MAEFDPEQLPPRQKVDPEKLKVAVEAHARELLVKGLPPSLPPVLEEFCSASERHAQMAEDLAKLGGATEIPKSILDEREAFEKLRRGSLHAVEAAMQFMLSEIEIEAKTVQLKASISDRPALQQLYAYLLAKYLDVIPEISGDYNFKERVDNWLWSTVRAELKMGGLTTGFFFRKSRKEFPPLPITATAEQHAGALWQWIDFVVLQVYQLKYHVRLQGLGSTDEDMALIVRMSEAAREEARSQLRASGRLAPK